MRWSVNLGATRLVDELSALLWRPRCLLCRHPGHAGLDLCLACCTNLPWNRSACSSCALPLPALPGQTRTSAAVTFPALRPAPVACSCEACSYAACSCEACWCAAGSCAAGSSAPCAASAALISTCKCTASDRYCGNCLRKPPPVTRAYAVFAYRSPLDRLLPRLKFHQDMAAGRLLAQLSAAELAAAPRPQALIPIPLHDNRLRRRGYDQALELAQPIARQLNLPLRADLLRRTRATQPQSQLDAAGRRRNLRGAFAVCQRGPLPAHVVLFDDVMTTGATLYTAANALRRAGIARVDAWVCARAPAPASERRGAC